MKRLTIESGVGLFVLVGLVCVGYLTIELGKVSWYGGEYYRLQARFASVTGLKRGANVEIAGAPVGQVDAISLDDKRMVAEVWLKIDHSVALSDDTIASVRTAGLIGDKYIRLSPGGSDQMLADGGLITDTESAIDIEELLSKYVFGSVK